MRNAIVGRALRALQASSGSDKVPTMQRRCKLPKGLQASDILSAIIDNCLDDREGAGQPWSWRAGSSMATAASQPASSSWHWKETAW